MAPAFLRSSTAAMNTFTISGSVVSLVRLAEHADALAFEAVFLERCDEVREDGRPARGTEITRNQRAGLQSPDRPDRDPR